MNGLRVVLSWTAAAGASSYLLEIGGAPGGPYTRRNIGALTTFGVTAPAGGYYLRVRGINAAGEGLPSNEVFVQTVGTLEPPGVPTGLSASVSGRDVTLAWSTPSTGGPVDDYVIEVVVSLNRVDTSVTSVEELVFAPNVPPGRYYARVRARNVRGLGAPSSILTVDVL